MIIVSTMTFGPKTHYSIGPSSARVNYLIQNLIWPKIVCYIKTIRENIQTGKTYVSSEVSSPLVGCPNAYRIFIHSFLNSVRLKTIILNKRELVFDKERQILSLSS